MLRPICVPAFPLFLSSSSPLSCFPFFLPSPPPPPSLLSPNGGGECPVLQFSVLLSPSLYYCPYRSLSSTFPSPPLPLSFPLSSSPSLQFSFHLLFSSLALLCFSVFLGSPLLVLSLVSSPPLFLSLPILPDSSPCLSTLVSHSSSPSFFSSYDSSSSSSSSSNSSSCSESC